MKSLFLNILVAISAIAAIYFDHIGERNLFTILKPLTTVLIIAIPVFFGNSVPKKLYSCIVVGLIFCLLGDTLLLNSDYFIYGLLAFLIGHLIFMVGFISFGGWKMYWKALILLLGISGAYLFYIVSSLEDMLWPVVGYMMVIVLMSWQGVGLYLKYKRKAFLYIAIGVILFMLSDTILSFNKFHAPFYGAGILVLTTYWTAIAFIANSTVYFEKLEK